MDVLDGERLFHGLLERHRGLALVVDCHGRVHLLKGVRRTLLLGQRVVGPGEQNVVRRAHAGGGVDHRDVVLVGVAEEASQTLENATLPVDGRGEVEFAVDLQLQSELVIDRSSGLVVLHHHLQIVGGRLALLVHRLHIEVPLAHLHSGHDQNQKPIHCGGFWVFWCQEPCIFTPNLVLLCYISAPEIRSWQMHITTLIA